jgi:Ca2+-transporting ATPase
MTLENNGKVKASQPMEQEQEWHALEVEEALKSLESQEEGLTSEVAAQRLAQYGPNELQAARHISPWEILFEQFKNVLIIILIIATALSAFLGEGVDAVAIAVIVLFAVGLGFVHRSIAADGCTHGDCVAE